MALELHLWKPAHFHGNKGRGKDIAMSLLSDACYSNRYEVGSLGRGGSEGERRTMYKQKVHADVNLR